MKEKRLLFKRCIPVFILLVIGYATVINAQETVSASGGNASGTGGSVSNTAGQLAYTTCSGAGGTLFQGVQLPFEISVVTETRDYKDILIECVVEPNPVSDVLKLTIGSHRENDLSYQIFDINGKKIESKKIENSETIIPMNMLMPAVYFINIFSGRQEVKSFKIIKN